MRFAPEAVRRIEGLENESKQCNNFSTRSMAFKIQLSRGRRACDWRHNGPNMRAKRTKRAKLRWLPTSESLWEFYLEIHYASIKTVNFCSCDFSIQFAIPTTHLFAAISQRGEHVKSAYTAANIAYSHSLPVAVIYGHSSFSA